MPFHSTPPSPPCHNQPPIISPLVAFLRTPVLGRNLTSLVERGFDAARAISSAKSRHQIRATKDPDGINRDPSMAVQTRFNRRSANVLTERWALRGFTFSPRAEEKKGTGKSVNVFPGPLQGLPRAPPAVVYSWMYIHTGTASVQYLYSVHTWRPKCCSLPRHLVTLRKQHVDIVSTVPSLIHGYGVNVVAVDAFSSGDALRFLGCRIESAPSGGAYSRLQHPHCS